MKLVAYCSFMFLAGTAMFLEKNFSYISNVVFRAAVRLQFMETSNAGREPTEDQ